jgi:hypothetical protein
MGDGVTVGVGEGQPVTVGTIVVFGWAGISSLACDVCRLKPRPTLRVIITNNDELNR